MSTWNQLTGQTILEEFGIQFDATTRGFIRARDVGSRGGPWSFLLFTNDATQLDMLTMCIATFDDEFIDAGFEPFKNLGGRLNLSKHEIHGLIEILEAESALFPEAHSDAGLAFQTLDNLNCARFHLNPEWFSDSIQQYYQLVDRKNIETNLDNIITILSFGTSLHSLNNDLSFSIMRFSSHLLEDVNFTPDDGAEPCIDLNRVSARALIELFRRYL